MNRTERMKAVEASRIKFTSALVEEVGKIAEKWTGGQLKLGPVGVHPEHGTRYMDAHKDLVWHGAKGAREACAYYSGGLMRYAYERSIKVDSADAALLFAVQVAYGRYGDFTKAERAEFDRWEVRGEERADEILNAG